MDNTCEVMLRDLNIDFVLKLFGALDGNIEILENEFGVRINSYDDAIRIVGEPSAVKAAEKAIRQLEQVSRFEEAIDVNTINYVITMIREENTEDISAILNDCICLNSRGKPIKPKTVGQQKYVDAIKKNTITFGVGPAGTGKTFLAVALAVTALKQKQISRIILTRPAVEAGEKLGFLPGDLQQKIDPYLRPLYDALGEMLGGESFAKHMEKNTIEIAPLAYMRGRTLSNAFIILDEAQNTTKEQMKMFLTRMGEGSRMVITGDLTQIDLPEGKKSGLKHATRILGNINGIGVIYLTASDVVRHSLVMEIIRAYERAETTENKELNEKNKRKT